MAPAFLFLLTGIATAIPAIWAIQWIVWGAPKMESEYISLVGSLILLVATVASILKAHRVATRLALIGALAAWFFYIPLLVKAVWAALSSYSTLMPYAFPIPALASPLNVLLVIALALLFLTTLFAIWASVNKQYSGVVP